MLIKMLKYGNYCKYDKQEIFQVSSSNFPCNKTIISQPRAKAITHLIKLFL